EGDCADVERTLTGAGDLDPRVVVVRAGSELERDLGVRRTDRRDGDGLPARRSVAPNQADRHLGARRPGQDRAPNVSFSFAQRDAGLLDASRVGTRQLDEGRVLADIRIL